RTTRERGEIPGEDWIWLLDINKQSSRRSPAPIQEERTAMDSSPWQLAAGAIGNCRDHCSVPNLAELLCDDPIPRRSFLLNLSRKSLAPRLISIRRRHTTSPWCPVAFTSGRKDPSPVPPYLALLPALTHFAKGAAFGDRTPSLAKSILAICKTLQKGSKDQFIRGRVAETRGGIDFWARADAFIAKKQRRKIQPGSRCWIEIEDRISGIPESI
ncbi:hypothetical protein C8R45DRAFT_1157305, partial [Mycena sanguinolenta]